MVTVLLESDDRLKACANRPMNGGDAPRAMVTVLLQSGGETGIEASVFKRVAVMIGGDRRLTKLWITASLPQ